MLAPSVQFDPSLAETGLRLALVYGSGLTIAKRNEAPASLAALLSRVRAAGEPFLSEARKKAVRDIIRHGKYKPAGRSKPSSEYLLAAALEGSFPLVNGAVDANNAASLAYGYPASIFDLAMCGPELLLRRGGAGDSYQFNLSGQEIDLEDLLCVWMNGEGGGWLPIGNPVKDSMATKVFELCVGVVGVIYAPQGPEGRDLEACAELYAGLLESQCGAAATAWTVTETRPQPQLGKP
ncbi:MAG: hypothetical protein WCQ50_17760 [Spirochaetota bacterium]